MQNTFAAAVAIAALCIGAAAYADQTHGKGHGQGHGQKHGHYNADIGSPGTSAEVDRTVNVTAGDIFFEPAKLSVQKGETIRFVIRNEGALLHEFAIGTAAMHARHREEMAVMQEHGMITPTGIDHKRMKMDHSAMGMPAMHHDDPNSVLLEPGETRELIWTFTTAAQLEFSCNVPGHPEAGMVGAIEIGG